MSGKPNTKWLDTMIIKYGSREAVTEAMRSMGALGGAKSRSGGFACLVKGKDGLTGPERASSVGQKGGRVSRRRKHETV